MEPPALGDSPRPLVRYVDMSKRDSNVHLGSLPVQLRTGYVIVVDKPEGLDVQDLNVTRALNDHHLVTMDWSSPFAAGEQAMTDLLCGGRHCVNGVPLQLLQSDGFVRDLCAAVKDSVGSQRIQTVPKRTMSIRFGRPVKATPSPIPTTLASGSFELGNHIFMHFEFDDTDSHSVVKIVPSSPP
eukprot:scaffold509_cov74-Cyclotella_meneghiniana.AAC.3